MTDREVMQQALEALKEAREAVEHWASYADEYYRQKWNLQGDLNAIQAQITALRAALAEPEQEPVAWLSTDCIGERYLCFSKPSDNDPVQPLYAAPPQRKPLVDPAEYDDAEVESDYE